MRNCCFVLMLLSSLAYARVSANAIQQQSSDAPWHAVAKLTSSPRRFIDNFGRSVAISKDGKTIVTGASGIGWDDSGAVYVFVEPSTGWTSTSTYVAKLTLKPWNSKGYFGESVAISGDTIFVSSEEPSHQGSTWGAVYVYVKPAGGWQSTSEPDAELTVPAGHGYNSALGVIAADDNTVVVGGAFAADESGVVFVFVKPESVWIGSLQPAAALSASNGYAFDEFGESVAIEQGTIVVGAIQAQGGGTGEAYVFIKPSSGWTSGNETTRLTASDGQRFDSFGISSAISGDTVVIGASKLGVASGSAYVFVRPTSGWADTTETAELTPSNQTNTDGLTNPVAICGDTIFVGVPGLITVFEFLKPKVGWQTTSHFDAQWTVNKSAVFGESLSLRSNTLVVGSGGAAFVGQRTQ